jgi:hypothetical protein
VGSDGGGVGDGAGDGDGMWARDALEWDALVYGGLGREWGAGGPKEERLKIVRVGRMRARVPSRALLFPLSLSELASVTGHGHVARKRSIHPSINTPQQWTMGD